MLEKQSWQWSQHIYTPQLPFEENANAFQALLLLNVACVKCGTFVKNPYTVNLHIWHF